MQENDKKLNPDELNVSKPVSSNPDELEAEEKIMEGVEELVEEDFDKKTYLEITPTLYIKAVESDEDEELFKIFNPETQDIEVRELNDREKKLLYVKQLKESQKVFNPIKHKGKITTNQFGAKYKQKRKKRNKLTKNSRKANR